MISSIPATGFRIYDILSRIIPGTIFVILFLVISYTASDMQQEYNVFEKMISSSSLFVIILGIGLVVGEIIQLSRSKLHPVPYPFTRVLYHQSGDPEFLSKHDKIRLSIQDATSTGYPKQIVDFMSRWSPFHPLKVPDSVETKAQNGFWSDFKSKFGLNDRFDRSSDVYGLLIAFMEPRMSSDLERYRAVVDFMSNLTIVVFISGYISLFVFAADISLTIVGALIITTTIAAPSFVDFFGFLEREYVNRLLLEYLLIRKEEQNEEDQDTNSGTAY